MTNRSSLNRKPLLWAPLLGVLAAGVALANEFTYQGVLNDGGSPATGLYDLQFKLYDAPMGGNVLATQENLGVTVIGGLFTVILNFGSEVFDGSERHIEVCVRPGGGGGYTLLEPRNSIGTYPYSINSIRAASADQAHDLSALCVTNNCVKDEHIESVDGGKITGTIPGGSLPNDSPSYIQNTTTQQAANFRIDGTGTADILNVDTQYNLGFLRVLGTNPSGSSLYVGLNAGTANTGDFNSFFGTSAGADNTTGSRNSFFGHTAGQHNTTGQSNSFFGVEAGESTTTGGSNTFVGSRAGFSNTTAPLNSFFGFEAGEANTTATGNAFFGATAGESNTTGGFNSFFGYLSGRLNVGGMNNAFFGAAAGQNNTGGGKNCFLGVNAGLVNTDGENNTFLGYSAGQSTSTGSNNTFVGYRPGSANQTGSNNTLLGADANFGGATPTNLSFATAIGAGTSVSSSNTVVLGRSADVVNISGTLKYSGTPAQGAIDLCRNANLEVGTCSSSIRYKTNVQDYYAGLELVSQLRPVSFTWIDGGMPAIGLIAEEVDAVEPLLTWKDADGQVEGVAYKGVTVVLLNAVMEQQAQIDEQRRLLEQQQRQIDHLLSAIDGTIITDEIGEATVELPKWFVAQNTDFRYQLTVIDEANGDDFVLAKVVRPIKRNRFTIRTSAPSVTVSWQVTGVRHDAYAWANPLQVEMDKGHAMKGGVR